MKIMQVMFQTEMLIGQSKANLDLNFLAKSFTVQTKNKGNVG